MREQLANRPKVAIVYHYFAHYRRGVIEALLASDRYDYLFCGDTTDPYRTGVAAYEFADPSRFFRARCYSLGGPFLWQTGLLRLSMRRDIETIIYLSTPYFLSTWLYALCSRLCGKRVLFWGHTWYAYDAGLKAWFKYLFLHLAQEWLVYGNVAKRLGVAKGFPAERIHVIYNSLDYDVQTAARERVTPQRLVQLRAELFGGDARPVVIYIGRLVESKQVQLLLAAAVHLRDQGHDVNLLLVGDGPQRSTLEHFAHSEGLSAHFYGPCYDENRIAELVMLADVTASPGNVGLAAIHSLTYGTPIVTHDDPAHHSGPELETIVPGVTGGFFRRGDAADLARAIREWTIPGRVDEVVRARCRQEVDCFWNPASQRMRIERAIDGQPPLDDWTAQPRASPETTSTPT